MSTNKKLFIGIFFSFIAATVIGTLSHESGHYLAAKFLGYDAKIHYGYTHWRYLSSYEKHSSSDGFWIILWGPLQTMLTFITTMMPQNK